MLIPGMSVAASRVHMRMGPRNADPAHPDGANRGRGGCCDITTGREVIIPQHINVPPGRLAPQHDLSATIAVWIPVVCLCDRAMREIEEIWMTFCDADKVGLACQNSVPKLASVFGLAFAKLDVPEHDAKLLCCHVFQQSLKQPFPGFGEDLSTLPTHR